MNLTEPLLHERLSMLLSGERVVEDLQAYFATPHSPAEGFTGRRFEHLAGGGDHPDNANSITPADLIALQTLSVQIRARTALDLLEGQLGEEVADHLRDIPTDVDLAHADPVHIEACSPAHQAWDLLQGPRGYGIGWVIAGKLLARKRPRLLPVYDRVVRCALGYPDSLWCDLRQALKANDRELQGRLLELRTVAGLPMTISPLRVCDVAVWMQHRTDHRPKQCPGPTLLPSPRRA